MSQSGIYSGTNNKGLLIPVLIMAAMVFGWLTSLVGIVLPILVVLLGLAIPFVIIVFNNPKIGLISFIVYSFLLFALIRAVGDLPFSVAFESLLVLSWLGALLHNTKKYNWAIAKNELTYFGIAWFLFTLFEFLNPVGGLNVSAWIKDARYPLLWVLIIPLTMVVFKSRKDLNIFLLLILAFSLLAAVYGVKQLKIGLFQAEKDFLVQSPTHLIFGQLRVFSFYSDAGQFGASMAQFCVIAGVLALGPFKKWKKVVCGASSLLFLYAMFISGTRGALFALVAGIIIVLIINKSAKVIIVMLALSLGGFVFLKYTFIGQDVYEIRRMRSALNPDDPSLNVRFGNQANLAMYLKSKPLGAGVGSIGFAAQSSGHRTPVSAIPTDSYWVKIWVSYGIVGLIIWFGMMMFIIGKCCGIVWKIQDKNLKFKLTALTAGATGIFFSSYGNEVMNSMPSSMILYFSWAFVFLGPILDRKSIDEEESEIESKESITYA